MLKVSTRFPMSDKVYLCFLGGLIYCMGMNHAAFLLRFFGLKMSGRRIAAGIFPSVACSIAIALCGDTLRAPHITWYIVFLELPRVLASLDLSMPLNSFLKFLILRYMLVDD